ncbi:MAG: carbonic anhydrase [Phycisphaerales bacterium]|nr:carbonic anhydrase [Phycisphaerales bacterium]
MARKVLRALTFASAGIITVGLAGSFSFGTDDHHSSPPKPAPKPVATKPMARPAAEERTESAPTSPAPRATKVESKPAAAEPATRPTPDAALKLLQDGNQRWVNNQTTDPNTDSARRSMLADKGQNPFAIVLTCADSRLPVERLFDRGTGDLFVIRVAGNVAGTSETGTIQYGVGHLKSPLLVVMGHTKCGAVAAAASNADVHGKLADLLTNIAPAVDRAKRANPDAEGAELNAAAVKENVWQTVFDLIKYSPEVRSAIGSGELKIVGAVCDISTGKVDWMGEHPWQAELVAAMNARSDKNAQAAGEAEVSKNH